MTTTCPKCRPVRQPDERAPNWQCSSCGIVHAKAADAADALRYPQAARAVAYRAQPERRIAWGRWLAIAAVSYGAYVGLSSSLMRNGGGDISAAELQTLASATQPGEVVTYTTTHCPYCAQAKQWMAGNGFAFTECDAEQSPRCAMELQGHQSAHGAVGVPYLVVRGHHMKDGFDSDEFVAALKR